MRNVLIFVGVLAAFEWGLDRVASPFQGADKVGKKFAYYAAHKDEYDLVFIGSSRVMNQVDPRAFDAQMASSGVPCRSFNLGVAGMFLPECMFLVDQVRALHPARLRGMVIELSSPAPRHDADHPLTERDIYWHRPGPTLLACAAVWTDAESTATPAARWVQVGLQVANLCRCEVHLGAGPQFLDDLCGRVIRRGGRSAVNRDVVGPAADGFFPLLHTLGQGASHAAKSGGNLPDRTAFQDQVERLRGEIARDAREPAGPPEDSVWRAALAIQRAWLARQLGELQHAGVQPLAFIGPGTTREQAFLDLLAAGAVPTLLAFNDPEAHPDLYAPDVRADRNHLNAAGADRLSRQLARAVAAALKPAPGR